MNKNTNDGRRVLATNNLELDAHQEGRLMAICQDSAIQARKAQGYPQTPSNTYDISQMMPEYRSWMWWRVCAMKAYEHDYSWRTGISNELLWAKSNKTVGVFEQQVEQHFVEISRTMLRSHRFFTYKKEGMEDNAEVIKLVQRRLQLRSKTTDLRNKMDDALLKSMLCGEAIIKPSLVVGSRPVMRNTKVLLNLDGNPLKTTNGNLVPIDAEWVSADDGTIQLRNDKRVVFPANTMLENSEGEEKIWQSEPFNNGSRFDIIDHRDFICDPRWADLDEADYRGYEFSWTLDQMLEYLSGGWTINEEALEIYSRDARQAGSERISADHSSREELGEIDLNMNTNTRPPPSEETQPLILFCEEYVSADILGLGRRQDLFVIRDVARNIPVCYTFAKDTLPWVPGNPKHGFIVMKSGKVADRWYGSGYFKDMFDDSQICDELLNQGRLEVNNSGNVIFMKPKLIKNVAMGEDGQGGGVLRIRGDIPNELSDKAIDASEAFSVITIEPQAAAINDQLEFHLGRVRSRWGQVQPDSSAGMEGANTAFGMNMIAEKSNAHLNARQKVISDGLDKCVEVFSRIELLNTDKDDLVEQMGKEQAEAVMAFIEANTDNFADAIETMLANANSATALQGNMQAIQVVAQYRAWQPPEDQINVRSLFETILLGLDIRDTHELLKTNDELLAEAQQKLAEQQAAAGIPAGAADAGLAVQNGGAVAGAVPAKPNPAAAEGQTPPPAPATQPLTSTRPPRQPPQAGGGRPV